MDNRFYSQRLTLNEHGKYRYKTINVVDGCTTQEEAYQICVNHHNDCRCEIVMEFDL